MPTTDIIGYLWHKRHAFGIETLTDVLDLTADLVSGGLDAITVTDQIVLGTAIGADTVYVRRSVTDWDDLVHGAVLNASAADAAHRMDSDLWGGGA